jgi:hypothetical protein
VVTTEIRCDEKAGLRQDTGRKTSHIEESGWKGGDSHGNPAKKENSDFPATGCSTLLGESTLTSVQ